MEAKIAFMEPSFSRFEAEIRFLSSSESREENSRLGLAWGGGDDDD